MYRISITNYSSAIITSKLYWHYKTFKTRDEANEYLFCVFIPALYKKGYKYAGGEVKFEKDCLRKLRLCVYSKN